ncbi:LacI family DNA-binding transcriptional regulator [Microbacterium invictum]|uniref:LacI family transcriptional regulator n=1 Tax=Microbacterium invictum TaxID=515415 RepID=A0AA40SLZ0_9MICO|nr:MULTISPECIES: LacI family DNA-binding transcriptional regulator [Microbacterium]MBB4138665.1 LacI family transcriptional regulator [Microbacterium invictum]
MLEQTGRGAAGHDAQEGKSVADEIGEVTPPISSHPRRRKAAPTIYDVARLADVNPSTVSRALSQPGRINVKTEQRILSAAKQLNYRLNPMARALPTGRTSTLALLVADITNPMFFNVVRGAERAAARRGYILVIVESQESGEREAEAAQRVLPSVDALVLVTSRLSAESVRELSERKPIVVLNRHVDAVASIVPDLEPGIDEALAHLRSFGHKSLAFLSGPATSWMSATRWRLLFEKAPEYGMSVVEIPTSSPTVDGGRQAQARVRAAGVSAVIAYNDLMAIGLLREAVGQGIRVPGDLSIVGFDDIFGSDFTSPPLTTVRTPLDVIGRLAVERALDLIDDVDDDNGADGAPPLTTELIVRGSTGPAGR